MVILTGGAGFIGSNTLAALNRGYGDDILVVDNIAATGKWKNLVGKPFRHYVHKSHLWSWLEQSEAVTVEAVIHLGACTDTMENDFDYLVENNVAYSQKLWRFCTENRIPLVYASSAATYGDGRRGFSDDHDQTAAYEPINAYGYSKHLFDLWALKQSKTPPRWYGLKFFNVYGPGESYKGRMASVASFAIPQALRSSRIRLFKSHRQGWVDGGQKRDFIFVGDIVDLILYFLEASAPSGLYNGGTGRSRSFNDLARAIFKSLKLPEKIDYFDMPETLRASYQYFTEADTAKLAATGFKCGALSLEQGMEQYVKWLRDEGRRAGPPD
ncbi:MAG: ADP-glyceromanno-heptose 6-epimerase [Desulfobacterales bacterium]